MDPTTTGPGPTEPVRVAGIDGCRGGWVVVTGSTDPASATSVEVVPAIGVVLDRLRAGEWALVGIDMPIGLPDAGGRASDAEARARLGARRSSLFSTPYRSLLGSASHEEASARNRSIDGKGLSIQAYNLLAKVAELDAALDDGVAEQVREVHPESSFTALAGAPLGTTKRSAEGRAERLALLAPSFPDVGPHLARRPSGAAADDVLDAYAVVWSVRRAWAGTATVLGDRDARDGRGRAMTITV